MTTPYRLPISETIIAIWNKYKDMPYDTENPDELDELVAMVADISENTINDIIYDNMALIVKTQLTKLDNQALADGQK